MIILAKYNNNPSKQHIDAVRRIFKYLNGTLDLGICYSKHGSPTMIAYSDSNWAGQIDGRKSTSGYVFMLAGGPISHSSKQQPIVALSSAEAKYSALTEAGKEAIWLSNLLTEFGLQESNTPINLCGDNQGAIALTANPEHHRRTKHIDIRYHWIRNAVAEGLFSIKYVPTKLMAADGFTKPLNPQPLQAFIGMLN